MSMSDGEYPYRYLYCPCGAIGDAATLAVVAYGPSIAADNDDNGDWNHRFGPLDDCIATRMVLLGPDVRINPSQIVYRWVPELQCWVIAEMG
jgi:hypothetical protein